MQFKSLLTVAAAISGALADTCNPLKSSNCPSDPALGTSIKETFSSKSKYFNEVNSNGLSYSSDGLDFKLAKRLDNPSIKSSFYLMFGKVEVVMKAAEGKGIISSFYLQSDDLDEVDIELVGGDPTQWQSNFFSKGDTTTYDRGQFHDTSVNPLQNYLTYTIEWTEEKLTWSVNGQVVRTLLPNNGEGYPQTPMYIMAGIWAGGDPDNAPGTIEWAGGETDYSKAPFDMYIKSIVASDYSSGKSYSYGDQSGTYESIKSDGGSINGRASEGASEFSKLVSGGTVENDESSSSASASSSTSSSAASSGLASSTVSSASVTSSSSVKSSSASSTVASITESSSSKSEVASTTESSTVESTTEPEKTTTSSAESSAAPKETTAETTTTAPTTAPATTPATTATTKTESGSTTLITSSTESLTASASKTATVTSANGAVSNSAAFVSVAFALSGYFAFLF